MSPVFTSPDIVAELVNEHTTVEPVVVQRIDDRKTSLAFAEGENNEKLCQTLWSIEIWLGHSVHMGCDTATPEQMVLGEGLWWVEREENVLQEGVSTQLSRPTPVPQHENCCPSVPSQVVGKMPKFSTFSWDPTQQGEVLFQQWVF